MRNLWSDITSSNLKTGLFCGVMLTLAFLAAEPVLRQAAAQTTVLTPFQTNASIGTTAVMNALKANPSRKGLMVCNAGPTGQTLYLTFGPITPTTTTGIPLQATGVIGTECLNLMPYMSPSAAMGAQVNAIGTTANMSLVALEF